ncbi:MAG: heavy-metal-associated domain-containing protein [Clostridia bacterium]|nr:heavy-metal-associated domain-containing protein [Clostridia bacterium]
MGNVIIIAILAVIVLVGLSSTLKHFKGEGGCCGGGGSIKENKKLSEPAIGEKMIRIEGMHCENCKNSVEHAVNRIEGAVCKVNLRKKTAKVTYSREIDDEELIRAIENLDFKVEAITK